MDTLAGWEPMRPRRASSPTGSLTPSDLTWAGPTGIDACALVTPNRPDRRASCFILIGRTSRRRGWHRLLALIDADFVVLADTEGNLFCVIDAGA